MPSPTANTPLELSSLTVSSNSQAQALIYGLQWANTTSSPSTTIDYSFITPSSSFYSGYDQTIIKGIQAFSNAQQTAFTSALSKWADVANINPVQTLDNSTTVGNIRVAFSTGNNWSGSNGFTYQDWSSTTSGSSTTYSAQPDNGNIWLDPTSTDIIYNADLSTSYSKQSNASSMPEGGYEYFTLLHELGHALGLKHPFDASSSFNPVVISPTNAVSTSLDSNLYTLMSYTPVAGTSMIGFTFNPTTPMLLDIAAMQAMYGANTGYNAGDTPYSFNDNPGRYYFQTIWDGGGHNTIAYAGNTSSSIDLRPGSGSAIGNPVYAYDNSTPSNTLKVQNLWIAYGTHIDTASTTGSGNNTLTANNDGDTLTGGAGNDILNGGSGNDIFTGGGGSNTLIGNGGRDTAVYNGAEAGYTIALNSAATLPTYTVTSSGGTDTLTQISRIKFSDGNVALDLSGNAGTTAKILGVVFSPSAVSNAQYVGIGLNLLDGGMAEQDLMQLALNVKLGVNFSNSSEVQLLYFNLTGTSPDASTLNYWDNTLATKQFTPAGLAVMAAELQLNATNIQLTGTLLHTGLAYIPAG